MDRSHQRIQHKLVLSKRDSTYTQIVLCVPANICFSHTIAYSSLPSIITCSKKINTCQSVCLDFIGKDYKTGLLFACNSQRAEGCLWQGVSGFVYTAAYTKSFPPLNAVFDIRSLK